MLAHELRNPLAPIRNGVTVLRLTQRRRRSVRVADVIERQARQMARLLDDLLDVSRITRDRLDLRREPVDAAGGDRRGARDHPAACSTPPDSR